MLKRLIHFLPFKAPTAQELHNQHSHEAELDLLLAQHKLEYYQAVVPMLEARLKRLKSIKCASPS